MLRRGSWLSIPALCAACATSATQSSEPSRDGAAAGEDGDPGDDITVDGGAASDGEQAPADGDTGNEDGGPNGGGPCACLHGSCEREGCVCEAGWEGATCDLPRFAGTGSDGSFTLASSVNLSTFNHGGRSCDDGGDAVAYNVVAFAAADQVQLDRAPGEGCLVAGDEVLLANLQGTASSQANVGAFEFLQVLEVSGNLLRFRSTKQHAYGASEGSDEGVGLGRTEQRVVLQRVPQYEELTVPNGRVLSVDGWDGRRGGVLALRVRSRLIVSGTIDLSGLGYQGAPRTTEVNQTGLAGEGNAGLGARSREPNGGGGGGGAGDTQCGSHGFAGGGGGHGVPGGNGAVACTGSGGAVHGGVGRLTLGAGGGAGGTDNALDDNPPGGFGGAGGGALLVYAREAFLFGALDVSGAQGEGDTSECDTPGTSIVDCWDFSGPGGGGAGGSIWFETESVESDDGALTALGGKGGDGRDASSGNAGDGAVGRIVIQGHGAAFPAETRPPATPVE